MLTIGVTLKVHMTRTIAGANVRTIEMSMTMTEARWNSPRERRMISDCFAENRSDLPPGLAKRDRLPPGLERQLQRNGTLPPGLQKRAQPLPGACTARLPKLPRDWARVVLRGQDHSA